MLSNLVERYDKQKELGELGLRVKGCSRLFFDDGKLDSSIGHSPQIYIWYYDLILVGNIFKKNFTSFPCPKLS